MSRKGRAPELTRPLRRSRLRPARLVTPRPRVDLPLADDPPATLHDGLRQAEEALDEAGVEESIADARLLLAQAMGASPTWIFTHEKEAFPLAAWDAFRLLVRRRARREPLQHLRGEQEFFGLRLAVSPNVLIPRPETELLVERLIEHLRGLSAPRIADVGTGSGCIAIAAATEIPGCRVTASDVSAEALDVAAANARELGVDRSIAFVRGSLDEPLRPLAPFDAVAANLPYVTSAEWAGLQPEVRDFEPRLALDGGEDGLAHVAALVRTAPGLLSPGGWIVLEVGHEQARRTADLLREAGFVDVGLHPDLAGIERIVEGRRPGSLAGGGGPG